MAAAAAAGMKGAAQDRNRANQVGRKDWNAVATYSTTRPKSACLLVSNEAASPFQAAVVRHGTSAGQPAN